MTIRLGVVTDPIAAVTIKNDTDCARELDAAFGPDVGAGPMAAIEACLTQA